MNLDKYLKTKENNISLHTQSSSGYYFNGGGRCYFAYNSNMEVIWHIDLEIGWCVMYLPEFLEHYNLILVTRESGDIPPTVEDEDGNQFTDIEEYLDEVDENWREVLEKVLAEYEEM